MHLYLGDCLDVLEDLRAESVDACITDPPLPLQFRGRYNLFEQREAVKDRLHWLLPVICEIYRALRRDSVFVCCYDWPYADAYMAAWKEAGFRPVQHLVFMKQGEIPPGAHEMAMVLTKGVPSFPRKTIRGGATWPVSTNPLYPFAMPQEVLRPLLEDFTRPGDVVLDPFMGTGATGVAALAMCRDFVGIEVNALIYHDAADKLRVLADRLPCDPDGDR